MSESSIASVPNTQRTDVRHVFVSVDVLERRGTVIVRHGVSIRRWGSGPTLFLIHGGVGSWTHWIRNIDALAGRFTVHAIDLPGYGDSADVPAGMTDDAYLDWVADIARDIAGVQGMHIVGFSFGGTVAAAVAARLGGLVHRLTVIAPGGFGPPVGRHIPQRRRPKDGGDSARLREVFAFNLGQWMLSTPPSIDDPVIDLHRANVEHSRFDSRRIGWRSILLPDLQRIACPVQILWGEHDRLAYPSVKERLEQCLRTSPSSLVTVIPQCAHWAPFEAARDVNERLLEFHAQPDVATATCVARLS